MVISGPSDLKSGIQIRSAHPIWSSHRRPSIPRSTVEVRVTGRPTDQHPTVAIDSFQPLTLMVKSNKKRYTDRGGKTGGRRRTKRAWRAPVVARGGEEPPQGGSSEPNSAGKKRLSEVQRGEEAADGGAASTMTL
jgi:hypothetical protein